MRIASLVLFTLVAATPVAAQEHDMKMSGGGFADIKPLHSQFMGWVVAAAEQMPEADYSYRPTASVRSFGEMVGHIAGANYTFCSTAMSEDNPSTVDFEKVTGKAALVAAVKGAMAYCDKAYAMPHGKEHDEVSFVRHEGKPAVGAHLQHHAQCRALWQHRHVSPDEGDDPAVQPGRLIPG